MMGNVLTIKSIAGYCMESALWKIIRDVVSQMHESDPQKLSPDDIIIDEDEFRVRDDAVACKEKDSVWYIGATISFVSSGHEVFGGKGKEYQEKHHDVQLPVLCREHENLTSIVHECLCADESRRITLDALLEKATTGYAESIAREKERPTRVCVDKSGKGFVSLNDIWPEEMVEKKRFN